MSRLTESGQAAGVAVRPRSVADVAACVHVLAEVHQHDGYPTRWPADPANWLSPPQLLRAWVAEDDSTIAGHVAVVAGVDDEQLVKAAGRPAGELMMISRLFVAPAGRGRGLGEALLSTATRFASRSGWGVVLDVVDQRRSAAIALYERLGWQLAGERPAGWTTPAGNRPRLRLYVLPGPPSDQ